MTENQLNKLTNSLKDLLWPYLQKVPGHPDRRQTGYGSKTLEGLARSVARAVEESLVIDDADRPALSPTGIIAYSFRTLAEARVRANRGTRWLSARGCNQILMVNRVTREVQIPGDVAQIWPGICDLMTE